MEHTDNIINFASVKLILNIGDTTMVKVEVNEKIISVISEYNPNFIRKARALHGVWQRPAWVFDASQSNAVRKALKECYGDDGMSELVKVRIDLDKCKLLSDGYPSLYFADKCLIATRFGRDSDCKLPSNVYCVEGGFKSRGGSMKHPCVTWGDDTLVEMTIPQIVYEECKDDPGVSLVNNATDKRTVLQEEKEKLLKRIKEIDTELANL